MKALDKKHRLAYQDVFLYTRVTSHIVGTTFEANISTPFKYKDSDKLEVYTEGDVVTGIGQRNYQRDTLYNNRGKIIIFRGTTEKHCEKLVGKYSKTKNLVTLYITERLLPEEIKVLNKIKNHLTENDISVTIDIDEKHRYRNELRRRRGDRIQGRHRAYESDDECDEF